MLFRDKIYNMEHSHDPHPHDVPGIPEALHRTIEQVREASTESLMDQQSELFFKPTTQQEQDKLGVVQQELAERIGKGTLDQPQ